VINEEKNRQEAELAASLSITERLDFGQRLFDQAIAFYSAVQGGVPGRETRRPDLDGVVMASDGAGLPYVVVGGFATIAHGCFGTPNSSDLLIPNGPETDEAILRFLDLIDATDFGDGKVLTAYDLAGAHRLRVDSRHGVIDIMRGGLAPLDYETVADQAIEVDVGGVRAPFASLRTVVGFKRLADRGQDRLDLENLERVNGELPIDPIPGLDT
jgi:hypothetical protein